MWPLIFYQVYSKEFNFAQREVYPLLLASEK